jgi:hypothetical protein
MNVVANWVAAGEPLQLTRGPDSICDSLQGTNLPESRHCFNDSCHQRDQLALAAVNSALGKTLSVEADFSLTSDDIKKLRRQFRLGGDFRKACVGCEWSSLCDENAANKFVDCVIK